MWVLVAKRPLQTS